MFMALLAQHQIEILQDNRKEGKKAGITNEL